MPSAPPAAAVHSLAPEDPRPRPRPLRVDGDDIRAVGVEDLRTSRIVEVVADPEDAWTADAGASDHFLRGGLVVQVRRADNAVIGVFSSRYALSVRPEDYEPALDIAEDAAGPSARGGRGTRHPTSRRELLRRMESAGFVVTPGSTHGRVTHPDHPGLVVPFASTPSDRRFTRHAVAQIRRVFGIDLRR
ncbi:MAG: type II toxin-antitoxin system HicA family toxin [Brachybacterium alimentarium]